MNIGLDCYKYILMHAGLDVKAKGHEGGHRGAYDMFSLL